MPKTNFRLVVWNCEIIKTTIKRNFVFFKDQKCNIVMTTIYRKIINRVHIILKDTSSRLFRPGIPKNSDGRVLIHLGCGDINIPGYINVDAFPKPHVHYVSDVKNLSIFPNNYADLVYACHILEHIPRKQVVETLVEWRRVLKPQGVLRISVPDFDLILEMYNKIGFDVDGISDPLLGGQNNQLDFHYAIFSERFLSTLLKEAGFLNTRKWSPIDEKIVQFSDWSSRSVKSAYGNFFVSLNMEAIK